jgi:phosphoribosylformylglycinamidine synthase II
LTSKAIQLAIPAGDEPVVDEGVARDHGLTAEEYARILKILGRTPTYTELGMYSVMWSEHCSYKNSIKMLKTLPRSGGRLLVSAGEENAGLVDIGDGLAVAFKIESHNHPSAVEPYQGAATGVGGIMRDIFTMGARPICALNSLRFGRLSDKRTQQLFRRVVKGIGDYGNSFGVPTVGGEIYFEDCYRDNPLVNAMAVGIVEHGKIARSVAKGVGNLVILVGSATGRDGIHGATFASEEISDESESRRPSVQVGDPFTEKLLLEATIEAVNAGLVVGIQDMGAAGITCSSTEMAAKGRVGMELNLDKVELREKQMSSYEIMLSESQERMLLIVQVKDYDKLSNIFRKWNLEASVVGQVTSGSNVRVFHNSRLKADVPASTLVLGEGAPVYEREWRVPAYVKSAREFDLASLSVPTDLNETLMSLLGSPSIASKKWAYSQYDQKVRTNTLITSGIADAAVLRIKETRKAISVTTDCNSRYVYLNPRRGGQIAVAEAARNVVCTGARPIAITNCLNFGNPYDPEIFWQFREAVLGIGDACRALGTPVTGGNVSFYNESEGGAVYPTPVIGMLGLLEDSNKATTCSFKHPGDRVLLLGGLHGDVGGSEYLFLRTGEIVGDAPEVDLARESRVQSLCLELIDLGLVNSAHDVAEGGIAVALAEMGLTGRDTLGATISMQRWSPFRSDFILFGEGQSEIIVTCPQDNVALIQDHAHSQSVEVFLLGEVTETRRLNIAGLVDIDLNEAREVYENAIGRAMMEE